MTPAAIVADFGTSLTKWSLLKLSHGVASLERAHVVPRPTHTGGDASRRHWRPSAFLRHMADVVGQAVRWASREGCNVEALCCTTTTSTVAGLTRTNSLSNIPAIRWDDRRAVAEAAQLNELCRRLRSGPWTPFTPDSAPPRALWLYSAFPAHFESGGSIIEQIDLANLFWSGERVLSESVASRKWGFSSERPWSPTFRKAVDELMNGYLDAACTGRIVEASQVIGTVIRVRAEYCDLPHTVRVISAPYDTMAQVVGVGLLHQPASVAVSLGTSMGVFALAGSARHSDAVEDPSSVGGPCGPLPDVPFRGYDLYYDGLWDCGRAIDKMCTIANLYGARSLAIREHEIARCLRDTQPGASNVVVVPYFNGGLRSDGSVCASEMTAPAGAATENLVRAVFEAIGYHVRILIERIERATCHRFDAVLIGGGPSNNRAFMQMIADITGREVRVSADSASGLTGCAISAAVGLRWYESPVDASCRLARDFIVFAPRFEVSRRYEGLYHEYERQLERRTRTDEQTGQRQSPLRPALALR
jgi:sugar (pentulose or hexulose) kinase